MSETFDVTIVEAERELFAGRVTKLSVPAVEGCLIILPGHTRLMASLTKGIVKIEMADGAEETIDIVEGLVQVTHEKVTIVVGPTGATAQTNNPD